MTRGRKEDVKHSIRRVRKQLRRAQLTLEQKRRRRAVLRFFQGKGIYDAAE